MKRTVPRRVLLSLAGLTAASLTLSACVGGAAGSTGSAGATTLHLVGFAVPKEANNAIQAKFAQTPAGQGTVWQESYGASGDQSRAVVNGLAADYVNFSLEGDVTRLVDAGLVDPSWNTGPTKGIVADSVVVLVVAKGNPHNIRGWADLIRPGIRIITPNPASSGSARWNILAAYQQVISQGGTEAQAEQYLASFFGNVVALPGSGRDASNAFLQGTADVLISYENEAILARQSGEDFEYIVPEDTLLIENPGAVTKNANPRASDYLNFVLSSEGQVEFARKGFRPVTPGVPLPEVAGANDPAAPFPKPARLSTVNDNLGGWSAVNKKFFADSTGLVPRIQQQTGRTR
ncbi:sulfate ABC transporter substrate-binding protein [Granulicoccus phenolivorans]|uniref:sulfate ABC transporter substrate-binding protein n=1 Tax=Granulicoccus phenolivorans TaxID=266854 RepID=UPI00040BBD03|nr:sulfate ABC transporter substrate-binding protein [Granulicoccus phenolivorans]